jgi:tryptophan-rich hypothetical protein
MAISPLKSDTTPTKNHVHPKKLLLSKWTAVRPTHKEKHFWVVNVIEPEQPGDPVVEIELQAAMTGRVIRLAWRSLKDQQHWLRGWV